MQSSPKPHSGPKPLTRRRMLGITAAAAGLPLVGYGLNALAPRGEFVNWTGAALGAEASMSLWHADPALSRRMIDASLLEIARLERVFSLFDAESELSRLNRDGRLDDPSRDLVDLLSTSVALGDASGGSFDVTVQPLWTAYERHYFANPAATTGPTESEIAAARALVDYRRIEIDAKQLRFEQSGMGVTLNGIAQGYITDRVADMLRDAGFEHVVAELGETRALGDHPEGRPWRMGIKDPLDPTRVARTVGITNQAMAVSGGYGTQFDAAGRNHHIFDPATGHSAARYLDVTVISPRATAADGLSTALCVVDELTGARMLAGYPGTQALITRPDGRLLTLSA
ncbi:MAG: FAD:protein FMN transferase [Alphaproteobacteria bacterium]|nr:FAD:protein FMN transferase [Alphaproteobacteria bacterium]